MNRYWSGLLVAMLTATVALGAQGLQGQNPTNTPPRDAAQPAGIQRAPAPPSAQPRTPNTVTLTGCVERAPMAAAAPGAATTSTAGQRFVLNGARMTASGDAAPSGAVGTTGTTASAYQLDGDAATISPHLNQRVEITGVIESSPAPAAGSATSTTGSTAARPTLRVSAVKMLASSCTPEQTTPGTTGQTTPPRQEAPAPQPQPEQQPQQQQAPVPPPQP